MQLHMVNQTGDYETYSFDAPLLCLEDHELIETIHQGTSYSL
jgi:hypothetical protein